MFRTHSLIAGAVHCILNFITQVTALSDNAEYLPSGKCSNGKENKKKNKNIID